MSHEPPAPRLAPAVLARRAALPARPAPVTLIGRRVRLAPLDLDRDLEALHAASDGRADRLGDRSIEPYDPDAAIWRFMSGGPFPDATALAAWLARQIAAPTTLAMCVRDAASDRPIGVATFMAASEHLKIELGNIWYGPVAQGTAANREATGLMLAHAFALGYRRVEWKCDALNLRSRRAAERIGFRFEGIQAHHMIVKERSRDTAWFRILADEWPVIRARLEAALKPDPPT
jgi:RimJ/RimL family protein N-acetyltransferase